MTADSERLAPNTERVDIPGFGKATLGLACRRCGCRAWHVLNTRRCMGIIRRRRQCRHCGAITVTSEKAEAAQRDE